MTIKVGDKVVCIACNRQKVEPYLKDGEVYTVSRLYGHPQWDGLPCLELVEYAAIDPLVKMLPVKYFRKVIESKKETDISVFRKILNRANKSVMEDV